MNRQSLLMNQSLKQNTNINQTTIQYLKILQLNQLELHDFLNEELISNPLLEEVDDYPSKMTGESYYGESTSDIIESMVKNPTSLSEHLLSQIEYLSLDLDTYHLVIYLIESLDENGYLNICLDDSKLKCLDRHLVESAISVLQSLDPPGVGARSLSECLILQLDSDSEEYKLLYSIISNHLNLVASNKLQSLSKTLGVSIEDIGILLEKISNLNPRPGLSYSSDLQPANYIIPDIFVRRVDKKLEVHMPESLVPRLRINEYYKKILKGDDNPKSREFLNKNLSRAVDIIRSLEQRKSTLKLTVEAIVEAQRQFFLDKSTIVPLNLKDIAAEIGMHESTISRAIKDKYLECDFGVFALKYFFSNKSISDSYGNSHDIKSEIKDIIKEEDPQKPYSDSKIVDLLKERGHSIARRTVVKYRESLDIPSSRLRKSYK